MASGYLRRYLLGEKLDAAMNYPFRDMVIGFLTAAEGIDAYRAAEMIESQRENYPDEAMLVCHIQAPAIYSIRGRHPFPGNLHNVLKQLWRILIV